MPLPSDWIDHIFAKLSVRYGASFAARYKDVKPELVKADWAEVLDGVSPRSLEYAFSNLPYEAPDAMRFRDICRAAPIASTVALPPADKPAPETTRQARAALLALKRRLTDPNRRTVSCLDALLAREAAGEPLTAGQRGYIVSALAMQKNDADKLFDAANFTPIPASLQPADSERRAYAEFHAQLKRVNAPAVNDGVNTGRGEHA